MTSSRIWKVLVGLGIVLMAYAKLMDTTVGSDDVRVHNVGLLAQQQTTLILGGVLFLAGVIVFALVKLKQTPEEEAQQKAAADATAAKARGAVASVTAQARAQAALVRSSSARDALLRWSLFLAIPGALIALVVAFTAHQRYASLSVLIDGYSTMDQGNRSLGHRDTEKMQSARQFVYDNLDEVDALRKRRNSALLAFAFFLALPLAVSKRRELLALLRERGGGTPR